MAAPCRSAMPESASRARTRSSRMRYSPISWARPGKKAKGVNRHGLEVGMDANSLRALQAPLKARYADDPSNAWITLRATGSVDDQSISCKVDSGRALAVAGLHPATGGTGLELCSGDMLLE